LEIKTLKYLDKATQTMIDYLHKNTGKSFEQWIEIVKSQNFAKHREIVKFLKEQHEFTHGFTNLVAHKANETDAISWKTLAVRLEKQNW
jgi:3-deoxy-D-arabino-heptulosonate 7-phosphate (DAHP) synthase